MVLEHPAVAGAPHAVGVRASLLFFGRTGTATDILPSVGVVVVAMGMTQSAAGGRGRAVLIIAPLRERLWVEVCVARVVSKDRNPALVANPVGVAGDVVGRVTQLHLSRQPWHGQGSAMCDAMGALLGVGWVGGGA